MREFACDEPRGGLIMSVPLGTWKRALAPVAFVLAGVPAFGAGAPPLREGDAAAEHKSLADGLMAQGSFKEAIQEYRLWLAQHPHDAAASTRLGICLQKTGNSKAARREYE